MRYWTYFFSAFTSNNEFNVQLSPGNNFFNYLPILSYVLLLSSKWEQFHLHVNRNTSKHTSLEIDVHCICRVLLNTIFWDLKIQRGVYFEYMKNPLFPIIIFFNQSLIVIAEIRGQWNQKLKGTRFTLIWHRMQSALYDFRVDLW